MTAVDDFEAVLDDDPRDWACRLAYSDWLEEHGLQAEAECQRWLVQQNRCAGRLMFVSGHRWASARFWLPEVYPADYCLIPEKIYRWLSAEKEMFHATTIYASRQAAEADLCQALQLAKASER